MAAAFVPEATRDSVVEAALGAMVHVSGSEMQGLVEDCMQVARDSGDFNAFRAAVYEWRDHLFQRIACDSRETIPLTIAMSWLAEGDVERSVSFGARAGKHNAGEDGAGAGGAGHVTGCSGIESRGRPYRTQ